MSVIDGRCALGIAIGIQAVADLDGYAVAALALEVQGGLGLELARAGVDIERRCIRARARASQRVGRRVALGIGGCVGAADVRVSSGVFSDILCGGSVGVERRPLVDISDVDGHIDGGVHRGRLFSAPRPVLTVSDRYGDAVCFLRAFVVEVDAGLGLDLPGGAFYIKGSGVGASQRVGQGVVLFVGGRHRVAYGLVGGGVLRDLAGDAGLDFPVIVCEHRRVIGVGYRDGNFMLGFVVAGVAGCDSNGVAGLGLVHQGRFGLDLAC